MTITHHPDPASLMSFAAGSLGEALSAVVAAHAAVCPRCRAEIRDLEHLGSVLMQSVASVSAGPVPAVDVQSVSAAGVDTRLAVPHGPAAPAALSRAMSNRLGIDLDTIRWRRLGPGVWHHKLPVSEAALGDLRLLRVGPGRRVPEHGHGGTELTLVLAGAYRDDKGVFGIGDIEDVDAETQHQPVADPQTGCICLLASEKPARFKGVFSRLLQPLTGL